jgi:hypothetical protein
LVIEATVSLSSDCSSGDARAQPVVAELEARHTQLWANQAQTLLAAETCPVPKPRRTVCELVIC